MSIKTAGLIMSVLLFVCLLAGCGGNIQEKPAETSGFTQEAPAESTYEDKKIGICIYRGTDNYMTLYRRELVDYLTSKGFSKDNIFIKDADNDKELQVQQVRELIELNVDALIVNPVDAFEVHYITDLAVGNNIPLVYVNREPSADEEAKWEDYSLDVTYVGCDARQSGILQGELLLSLGNKTMDVDGNSRIDYFLLEGAPENIDAEYRTRYSIETLANAGIKTNCLLKEVANWDRNAARMITYNKILEGARPEVIICNNDAMALGARDAVLESGLNPGKDVFIVGVDGLSEALEDVLNGSIVGTVFNDYISQSHSAADAVVNYLEGKGNAHYIGCNYIKITADNAQTYIELLDEM